MIRVLTSSSARKAAMAAMRAIVRTLTAMARRLRCLPLCSRWPWPPSRSSPNSKSKGQRNKVRVCSLPLGGTKGNCYGNFSFLFLMFSVYLSWMYLCWVVLCIQCMFVFLSHWRRSIIIFIIILIVFHHKYPLYLLLLCLCARLLLPSDAGLLCFYCFCPRLVYVSIKIAITT